MQQYEYRVENIDLSAGHAFAAGVLNQYAAEGWRLVDSQVVQARRGSAMDPGSGGIVLGLLCIMERRKPSSA